MTEYVGQAMPRYDGLGQVSGTIRYVDDFKFPGMLYVKLVRSPVHKGTIKNLDLSAVEKHPGVAGVVTADDIPGVNLCGFYGDAPVLNPEHLRYRGEPIAAVVAVDEDTAMEALEKVKMDIEEQKPVFDIYDALKPDAPLVRQDTENNLFEFMPGMTTRVIKIGDVEKGLAEADLVVEGTYKQGMQDHCPIEPHVSVARIDQAGRLEFRTHSQCLNVHLSMLGPIFDLRQSQINYLGGYNGGGFGGKNDIHADHIAGLAALKFRKPVKFRFTRQEDLAYSTKRGSWVFEYKTGVMKDGRIVACHIKEFHDSGGYIGLSPYAVEKCGMFAAGPYNIPNILVEGQVIFTNKAVSSSMRGYAVINGQIPMEIQMARIAKELDMNPWELRFINAWRDGDMGVSRYTIRGAGALESMTKTAELAGIELPEKLMKMSSRRR